MFVWRILNGEPKYLYNSSLPLDDTISIPCDITMYPLESILAHSDVNAINRHGMSPLMITYQPELCKLLLDHGADVNVQAPNGETLLHRRADIEIATILLTYGADIRTVSNTGYGVLEVSVASDQYPLCKLLLHNGADVYPDPLCNRYDCSYQTDALIVAWGGEVRDIDPEHLDKYLEESRDGAYFRRKQAIYWWFRRNPA
jgi:ankyrin repeat protein